jgi:hypothetical protein
LREFAKIIVQRNSAAFKQSERLKGAGICSAVEAFVAFLMADARPAFNLHVIDTPAFDLEAVRNLTASR